MAPKAVRRCVAAHDESRPATGPVRRPRIIDPHPAKVEECVEGPQRRVRTDVIHERLRSVGTKEIIRPPTGKPMVR
ncbi:hypothetical protein [Streptomyces sp. NPDC005181]|uniref:hypothetical protein n=1 Tax=Streptomyces sp. NPDC005181 TaxID=3156869 RepID=UPI0033B1E58C